MLGSSNNLKEKLNEKISRLSEHEEEKVVVPLLKKGKNWLAAQDLLNAVALKRIPETQETQRQFKKIVGFSYGRYCAAMLELKIYLNSAMLSGKIFDTQKADPRRADPRKAGSRQTTREAPQKVDPRTVIRKDPLALALRTLILAYLDDPFDPLYARSSINSGRVFRASGRNKEALAAFKAALNVSNIAISDDGDKVDVEVQINRAHALAGLIKQDDALTAFNTALLRLPENAETYTRYAYFLMELGHNDAALTVFNQALVITSGAAIAHANRASALIASKRYKEALTASEAALKIDPKCVLAHANCASAFIGLSRYPEALISSNTALVTNRKCALAYANRGRALFESEPNNKRGAVQAFLSALEIDKSSQAARGGFSQVMGMSYEEHLERQKCLLLDAVRGGLERHGIFGMKKRVKKGVGEKFLPSIVGYLDPLELDPLEPGPAESKCWVS